MKKKLTALLTVLLAILAASPVNAVAVNWPTTVIEATTSIPDITINVVVPATANAYINPDGLPVNINGKVSDNQILSGEVCIENKSEVPVLVSASVTGSINSGSNMVFSETNARNLTYKAALVFFQMQAVENPELEEVEWSNTYNSRKNILVTTGTNTKEDFITLGAGDEAERYGAFRLSGNCARKLTDDSWDDNDGFTAKIVFTFKPKRRTS
jgi:hypothetical protein